MYKSLQGMTPTCLAELCQFISADDARGCLQLAERGDLVIPRSTIKFSERLIAVSAALAWNSLQCR